MLSEREDPEFPEDSRTAGCGPDPQPAVLLDICEHDFMMGVYGSSQLSLLETSNGKADFHLTHKQIMPHAQDPSSATLTPVLFVSHGSPVMGWKPSSSSDVWTQVSDLSATERLHD